MILFDLLIINFISVLLIDISGGMFYFKKFIAKYVFGLNSSPDFSIKPFDCSLCMGWWACFAYLLITHHFTLFYVCIALLFACLTPVWKDFFYLVFDFLQWIITNISKITRI